MAVGRTASILNGAVAVQVRDKGSFDQGHGGRNKGRCSKLEMWYLPVICTLKRPGQEDCSS
jgi:hypothetical protein